MPSFEGEGRFPRWTFPLMMFCAGFLVLILLAFQKTQSEPQLPIDRALQTGVWADESRCIQCHTQAERFFDTGHAKTLQRADKSESLKFLKQFARRPESLAPNVAIAFEDDKILARHSREGRQSEIELDWCFGSGEHARTWVGTFTDSWGATDLVQFRWTWYHALDGFELTPGQSERESEGYYGGLGLLYDHPKTRRCFGCHTSHLGVVEGRLNEETLHPGVTCQACHGPRGRHVETQGAVREHLWGTISQEESINRCAQCHRRADELDSKEIYPDNKDLARFQPVGLTQSPCFQSPRMTCVICHDPHVPLEDQNLTGIWQCVQCHDGTEDQAACGAGRIDDCLTCHMPKVRGETPLDFTDHWIRVRSDLPQESPHQKRNPE